MKKIFNCSFFIFVLFILFSFIKVDALDFSYGQYTIQYQPSDTSWSVATNNAANCVGSTCTMVQGTYPFRSRYIYFGLTIPYQMNVSSKSGTFDYSVNVYANSPESFDYDSFNIAISPFNGTSKCSHSSSTSNDVTTIIGTCTYSFTESSTFSGFNFGIEALEQTLPISPLMKGIIRYGFNQPQNIQFSNFTISNLKNASDYSSDLNDIKNDINNVNNSLNNVNNSIKDTNNKLDDVNNTLNDDNVDDAKDSANSFFSTFQTDTFGLTGIITAPLNLIKSITSTSCSDLVLPLPFINTEGRVGSQFALPCMEQIYSDNFGDFFTLYQTITTGFIVQGFKASLS